MQWSSPEIAYTWSTCMKFWHKSYFNLLYKFAKFQAVCLKKIGDLIWNIHVLAFFFQILTDRVNGGGPEFHILGGPVWNFVTRFILTFDTCLPSFKHFAWRTLEIWFYFHGHIVIMYIESRAKISSLMDGASLIIMGTCKTLSQDLCWCITPVFFFCKFWCQQYLGRGRLRNYSI